MRFVLIIHVYISLNCSVMPSVILVLEPERYPALPLAVVRLQIMKHSALDSNQLKAKPVYSHHVHVSTDNVVWFQHWLYVTLWVSLYGGKAPPHSLGTDEQILLYCASPWSWCWALLPSLLNHYNATYILTIVRVCAEQLCVYSQHNITIPPFIAKLYAKLMFRYHILVK